MSGLRLRIQKRQEIRYLVAGIFNTGFGYAIPLILYHFFANALPAAVISAISAVIAITVAFLLYKICVFKTKGHWVKECLKCYLVYGSVYSLGVGGIWILVDVLEFNYVVTQSIVNTCIIAISYFSHKNFTFRHDYSSSEKQTVDESSM